MRRKIELVRIEDERNRKSTLEKKRVGLFKKLEKLATKCNAEVSAIVYGEDESAPIVWPSHEAVSLSITKWNHSNKGSKSLKVVDQESYLRKKVDGTSLETKKDEEKNEVMEMMLNVNMILYKCVDVNELNGKQRSSMLAFLTNYLDELEKKNHSLRLANNVEEGQDLQQANTVEKGQGKEDDLILTQTFLDELMNDELFLKAINEG